MAALRNGAAGTEDGTTELDRNTRVVLLLLAARHGCTTELLETWFGDTLDCTIVDALGDAVETLLVGWRRACLVVRSRRLKKNLI